MASLLTIVVLSGAALQAAAQPDATPVDDLASPLSLATGWRFHPGDDLAWAAPGLDDRAWQPIAVPGPWGRQGHPAASAGWYRLTLHLDRGQLAGPEAPHLSLGLGRVESSYELFAGGRRIGGLGGLPPRPRLEYDRPASWPIPPRAIEPSGRLVLALRVHRDQAFAPAGGGICAVAPRLGPPEVLAVERWREGWPKLAVTAILLAAALYHVFLFRAWREAVYLWFAILLLNGGAFVFLTSPWRFELTANFEAVKEAEYLARFLLPATAIQFLWTLFQRPISPPLRGYQLSHVLLAVLVVAEPGLRWNLALVRPWELWVVPLLVGVAGWVAYRAWCGERMARLQAGGVSALAAAFLWDIARGRELVSGPPLGPLGLLALAVTMAVAVADRLRATHRELAELHGDLERRVAERTAQLEAATRSAEAANRAKDDFLANMTHEIRTPMAGVSGLIELLARCDLDATAGGYITALRSSAAALERVVGEILDFRQIESGHLEIRLTPFSPRELASAIATLFRPLVEEKGLALAVVIDPALPAEATSDPARLRQVLVNLLSNALKFTEQGSIQLELRRLQRDGAAYLRCEVRDTGQGVDEATATRLFQPFSPGDARPDRRHGGTGLGLAISRRIVERLGGEIGFESAPGAGSRFWLEVPVEPLRERERSAEPAVVAAATAPSRQPRHPVAPVRWSLLVAEDDPISRLVVTRLLETMGHHVIAVESGLAALAAAERERFDLVFLDCQMPGLDGYATTQRLREREGGARHTPVVALTAHAVRGDRERCLAAGMDDYLVKPASQAALARVLERWLGGRGEPGAVPLAPVQRFPS